MISPQLLKSSPAKLPNQFGKIPLSYKKGNADISKPAMRPSTKKGTTARKTYLV